jgi:hypothetical protein
MFDLRNLKNLLAIVFLSAGGTWTTAASAADYEGVITNISAFNGLVYVAMSEGGTTNGGTNPCIGNIFIIDPTTPFGKTMLSVVVLTKSTGKRAYVWGDNSCAWTPYGTGTAQKMTGIDSKS